jgi:hypothetical protein
MGKRREAMEAVKAIEKDGPWGEESTGSLLFIPRWATGTALSRNLKRAYESVLCCPLSSWSLNWTASAPTPGSNNCAAAPAWRPKYAG